MNYETLLVNRYDHITMVKMNRAKSRNALEYRLRTDLVDCLHKLSEDDKVRVLILSGSGNAFCAGGDLRELREGMTVNQARKYVLHVSRIILAIQNMEKPVIAAVNGAAMGAGFSIAMACDMVVASETAQFSQAFVKVGLVLDLGGTYFLPRLLSLQKAKELAFTGKVLNARELMNLGLINKLVSPEDIEIKAIELAHQIAEGPPLALGLIKKLLNQSWHFTLEQIVELEAQYQAECMQSEDHMEGIKAFYEKRKAKFKGK